MAPFTKYFLPALLLHGLVTVYAAEDSFLFTQCECLDFDFKPTLLRGGQLSAIETSGEGLDCPGDKLGVIRDYTGDTQSDMAFTIETDFFVDAEGERLFWFMILDIDVSEAVEGQVYSLAVIDFPLVEVEISVQVDVSTLVLSINGRPSSLALSEDGRYQLLLAEIDDGNSKLILLAQPDGLPIAAQLNLASVNVIGLAADFVAPINVRLLNDDNDNDGRIVLTLFGMENDFNGLQDALLVSFNSANLISGFTDFNERALPVADPIGSVLPTDEDVQIQLINLLDTLTDTDLNLVFELDDTDVRGALDGFDGNAGTIATFTPQADDFEDEQFQISYSPLAGQVAYECTLTETISIDISAVEDVPVLFVIDALVFVQAEDTVFNVVVASSADFPDQGNILQEGGVLIETVPQATLRDANCEEVLDVGDIVDLVEGEFIFCYDDQDGVVIDAFNYTVLPPSLDEANAAEGQGTIILVIDEEDNEGLGVGAIAGVGVVGIVVISLIVAGVVASKSGSSKEKGTKQNSSAENAETVKVDKDI